MRKKIISCLLTLVMILSMLPMSVFAASKVLTLTVTADKASASAGETINYTVKVNAEAANKIASIMFTLDIPDGLAYVEGSGKVDPNFETAAGADKDYDYTEKERLITAATVRGFKDLTNLTMLTFSCTVKEGTVGTQTMNLKEVEVTNASYDPYLAEEYNITPATVTITKAPISSVTASVDAPVKGVALDTTVDLGGTTAYTGTVDWYKGNTATGTAVTGSAAANQVYTAKITLTAKTADGESFDSSLGGKTTTEGYKIKFVDAGKLELTQTFPKTNDKDTPVCVAPTGVTATFGSALSTITLTNPTGNTPGKWYWMDDAQKVGNVKDNPHTYKAKFVPNDKTNFSTVENIDVTVTATQVVLSAGHPIMIPIEETYTGSAIEPKPSIRVSDILSDELVLDQDYKITKYENNTNVGTGSIHIAPLPAGNYDFTGGSYPFTIKRADSSISIIGDPSKTYDGKVVNDPAVNKSGSTGAVTYTYYTNEDCTTETTNANSGATSNGAAPKNAGDYWVVAAVAASANYNAATSAAKNFTISQKDLTDDMITLGTQKTYNGTEQSVQIASVKDGTASLIATIDYTIESGNKAADVGNNTLVIKGKGNYTGEARATWSLVAKDVTITPDAKSKTYGATDPTLTYTTSIDSDTTLKNKFDEAKSGALSYTGTNVGAYIIGIGTLKAGKNFNLKMNATAVFFTINQATPVITATTPRQLVKNDVEVDITKWASFDNTDSGAKLTYVLDGTPTGITLTGNMLKAANDASTVSTFNIKVSAAATTNFTAPTEKVIVVNVVTKSDAGVSITTPSTSKTYGDANFSLAATKSASAPDGGTWNWNSSNPAILEIVSGADTATPTIKVKKADTAGATLTVTYTTDTHYGSANTTITVAQKEVTISGITAANKEYDGSTTATPTGTAVINGKVGSDDVTVTAGTATFADKNVGTGKTVTFTGYSLSGADAGNYNLKAQPASVTANITAKVVKLTGGINATDRSYVKDNKTVDLTKGTLTFDGLVSGETLDVNIPTTGTISNAKVGTYNVTYSGVTLKDGTTDKASNYKLVSPLPTVTVNITKAPAPALSDIPVSQKYNVTTGEKAIGAVMPTDAGALTYTKGAESKTGSVTVTSWAVDATGKVTYTLSGGKVNDTVTLSVVIKSTNYADATVNVVITIIKATPTGEPAYTKITTSGKTLNDAALTTTGSTLNPNAGTLVWVDNAGNVLPDTTAVAANTTYKWLFTPTDTNYESISGTIKLWSKSSGGSGSYYPAGITFTTDLPVGTINRVAVNGKTLDTKNYVVNGSDVTLLQSYLDTLKAGKYTVKIENKTHVSTGTFTIKADGTLSSPRTADAGVCLYAAMALMSGTGAAYVTLRRKKEN